MIYRLLLLLSFIVLGLIVAPADYLFIIIAALAGIALFVICWKLILRINHKAVIHKEVLVADLLLASLLTIDFYVKWLPSNRVILLAQHMNIHSGDLLVLVSCICTVLAFPAIDCLLYCCLELVRRGVFESNKGIYIKIYLGFLIVSFLESFSLEFSSLNSGIVIFNKSFSAWILNLSAAMIINLCFVLIIQRMRIAMAIPAFIIGIWSVANYYIIQFHGSPLYLSELINFRTAINVAGNYHYKVSAVIVCIILIFLLEVQIIIYAFRDKVSLSFGKIFFTKIITLLIVCICFFITYTQLRVSFGGWVPWDSGISRYGYFFCATYDLKKILNPYIIPDGYSVSSIEKKEVDHTLVEPEDYPDIIFILNESFYDLGYYMDIKSDKDYLSDFYSIPGAVYGHAVSPDIGGGTNDSEFELLMSKSMYLLNESAPFTYLSEEVERRSIVDYLKNLGYRTTGMHCEEKKNYNRDVAYTAMGFNEIVLGPENFKYSSAYGNRSWLDSDNYMDMLDHYEDNKDTPQFFYLLTFQNHGGYEQNDSVLDTIHTQKDFGNLTDDINEYLSSVNLSAEAFKHLTEYFERYDKKVIICMVGDHAPSFINELTERKGNSINNSSINQRAVPYVIWSNYNADFHMYTDYASMVDLAPMILNAAGLPLSVYYQTILNLHEVIPIRTSDGLYVDRDLQVGQYQPQSKYFDLMKNYYYMEYNSLLDGDEYQEELFIAE